MQKYFSTLTVECLTYMHLYYNIIIHTIKIKCIGFHVMPAQCSPSSETVLELLCQRGVFF